MMSFKKYYAELLQRGGLAGPTAEEAQRDFQRALAQANWAQFIK